MRRVLLLVLLLGLTFSSSGCLINEYSSNPNIRAEELTFQSEDLRQIENEWRRFWMLDQPSHMTFERVHGGIGP